MISLSTLTLLQHPDQLAQLRADPTKTVDTVEELLRDLSIAEFAMGRFAVQDTIIGGVTVKTGEGVFDPATRVATRAGQRLSLFPKEFAVLVVLLEAGGTVVSAEELLDRAWDEMADPFTNTVKMTI